MIPWYIFAILAAFFSGLCEIFKKKTLFKMHAMEFTTITRLFDVVIILFLVPFVTINLNIPWKVLLFIYGLSILGTMSLWLSSKVLRHMEISSFEPLYNLNPLFLLVLAYFVLGEKISSIQLFGIGVLLVGAYVLRVDHNITNLKKPFIDLFKSKYTRLFFLVLIFSSFVAMGEKYFIAGISPVTLLLLFYIFETFNLTILLCVLHDGLSGIKHGIKKAGKEIFLVSFLATLSNLSYYFSLSLAYVSLVLPIQKTGTLFATIIGGRFFKEKDLLQKTVACVIMIIGATLVILS